MGESDKTVVDGLPLFAQPWANLSNFIIEKVHIIGMPWVIILLSAYYGIPFAQDISATAKVIAEQQSKAATRLETLEKKHDEGVTAILQALQKD